MRRAARVFIHLAAGVSGVLFLLAVGFWIASYGSLYAMSKGPGWSGWSAGVSRGEMAILVKSLRVETEGPGRSDRGWEWSTDASGDLRQRVAMFLDPGRSPVCGFYVGTGITQLLNWRLVLLPLPFLVALFALGPLADAMFIRRRRRQRRRAAAGLCVACGYDLRASPAKCPECGAVPSPQAARLPGPRG